MTNMEWLVLAGYGCAGIVNGMYAWLKRENRPVAVLHAILAASLLAVGGYLYFDFLIRDIVNSITFY